MADATVAWQMGRPPMDCHKYMLENQIACDVTFLFPQSDGSGTSVFAHSYMLRCRSPVFEAMLSMKYKEGTEPIVISDVEPNIFLDVLRYMYYDGAELTSHNVLRMMFVAKKYLLDDLIGRCKSFLKSNMNEENVCTILNHCLNSDEPELLEHCMHFTMERASDVVKTDGFLDLADNALFTLVSDDLFKLKTEEELLIACMNWAEHRQQGKDNNLRDILGKSLYQIRFLNMETGAILQVNEKYNILTNDEIVWFFRRIMLKKEVPPTESLKKFNLNRRNEIVCRFKSTGTCWRLHREMPDQICFNVDTPLNFVGISVYGGRSRGDKHLMTVTLFRGNYDLEVRSESFNVHSDGSSNPVRLKFKKPHFALEVGVQYLVELRSSGPLTYAGENGLDSVSECGVTFTFSNTSSQNSNVTDTTRGQIPEIIFSL